MENTVYCKGWLMDSYGAVKLNILRFLHAKYKHQVHQHQIIVTLKMLKAVVNSHG